MRTTIEIKPEYRARLLELAARRGEKGFSSIVGEAIEAHLGAIGQEDDLRRRALKVRGSLSKREGERFRLEVEELRKSWR